MWLKQSLSVNATFTTHQPVTRVLDNVTEEMVHLADHTFMRTVFRKEPYDIVIRD